MRTTHFLTVYSSGSARCYGALVPVLPDPLGMVIALLEISWDLNLLTHEQSRNIWASLCQHTPRTAAPEAALNLIADLLTVYAPPGYAFQSWVTKDGTFWGWFPGVG